MKQKNSYKTAEGILFTDQYQLTMAQLYYRYGLYDNKVRFDYFFRDYPDYGQHKAGYCIHAGLEWLLNWMSNVRFTDKDVEYLQNHKDRTGNAVFSEDFIKWLRENGHFGTISMQAIPEGRVVHPNEPLVVVSGPLAICQILETALLNELNYQTLIATKASRIREIVENGLVLEFGARRGAERGAIAAARAALIGGADFSSNVGISHELGYPPKGTHAHSMVQVFITMGMTELDAFRAYADVYPDECLLLVDTINTLESGVPNAIKVFEELSKKGHKPMGIRLDSGDLAWLAIQAAKMLNDAGFRDTVIVLSNELDELIIWQILSQIKNEAPKFGVDADDLINRLVYGVGTRLITSAGAGALNGVYKLVAVYHEKEWKSAIKISETDAKIPNPGTKQVWRIYDRREKATADLLSLSNEDPQDMQQIILRHPTDRLKYRKLTPEEMIKCEPLLIDILKNGKRVAATPTIEEIRALRRGDVKALDDGVKRLMNPHVYHVSLTEKLWAEKQKAIESAKENG
ncbi:nicotinate phosphoribosyltransferase [candidate division KSB1 bacterium]|nr:nicotinate phosphoribosyltransferase [candidate division KSB1 bacterium]